MSRRPKRPPWACFYCGTHERDFWRDHILRFFCRACENQRRIVQRAATAVMNRAIRGGVIPKARGQVCVDCGGVANEYDHRDYRRPLDIQAVCHTCNLRRGPAEFCDRAA